MEFHQRNLSLLLKSGAKANAAAAVLDTYKNKIWELNQIPDEVAWDMLAASEYVNSIMTTLVRFHKRDHPLMRSILFSTLLSAFGSDFAV